MFIEYSISDDCINPDSLGEICLLCGCCSMNPNYRDRTIRSIRLYKNLLKRAYVFDMWDQDPDFRKIQERNMQKNILYFKKKIRLHKKILRCLKKG